MKRTGLKLMVGLSFCFCLLWCELAAQDSDWANLKRYRQANRELSVPEKGEKRVVFMGNSITEGWGEKHPEFFNENNCVERGISGQTSYQFLVHFRKDVINLYSKLVVINADTNDAPENTGPFDADITFGNIVSMVEFAEANKIKVILTSVLPASKFGWNPRIADAAECITTLNRKIEVYAKDKGILYVNYYKKKVSGLEC